MRETTQKNEACFDAQRSRLHWHLKQASLALEAYFIFVLIVVSGVCELISVKYSFFKPIHSNTSAYEKACVFYFFATNMVSTPLLLCVEELNIII